MCGFVIAREPFEAGLRAVSHRGIRTAVAFHSTGWVGHVRLPIVGVSEEYDQPIEAGKWIIAFVGEILNFRDIDPGLICDSELVQSTWIKNGPRGFVKFDGFWSIAALNTSNGDIHLLTDYLAQKPIYYRLDLQVAASEPVAVALAGPTTPDEIYLSSVIKWGYCPDIRRTPYNEIKKTIPGEWVIMPRDGDIKREIIDPLLPRSMTPAQIKQEIEQAIRRRVQSADVPVACLVSGGLDSAITYTIAKRYGDVRPYHVENGERLEAERVLGEGQSYEYLSDFTAEPISISAKLAFMQEPVDLGSLEPQIFLSRIVDESVCLTGDGADEFWSGYGRAERYDSQYSDVFHELPAWHLPRLDRVMMRNRVEVRSPFLARRVAMAALATPWEARKGKQILRDLFRPDLPEGVAEVPKRPLRTSVLERAREAHSIALVDYFRSVTWPKD